MSRCRHGQAVATCCTSCDKNSSLRAWAHSSTTAQEMSDEYEHNQGAPMKTLLRAGMWFTAFVQLAIGVVATLTPRAFYNYVPWVDLVPPFSEHLMRDYGAMNLALGLVTVVAAATMDRRMVHTALAAYLVFAVPHLLFHLTHHDHYTTSQAVGETTALTFAVLLSIALLTLTWRVPSPTLRTGRV